METLNKQKFQRAVVLGLYVVLFSIPYYLDIYYQTFYYVFISILFLFTMIFEFEEKVIAEEMILSYVEKTRERGLIFFAV